MPRYIRTKVINNDVKYYAPLRRGKKNIAHYATPVLRNPTRSQRSSLKTITHIWKYGDRFYKLADQFYGDVRFWWVIAWYNSVPTEANIYNGDVIEIPIDLQSALRVLQG